MNKAFTKEPEGDEDDDGPSLPALPAGGKNYITPQGHDRLRADLRAGGFERVELDDVRLRSPPPSARDVVRGFTRGTPLAHELAERGTPPEQVESAAAAFLGGEEPLELEHAAVVIGAAR